ncbi:MAG: MBL fold metallo-hydrolase [Desulfobulbus sp.]|nr:MAG: MBL fold metallo-hydrolase [Desulfobulbus sp.]
MTTSLQLGDSRISWLNGGEFELDGGTMYGAVPKVLWNKKYPADKDNYIRLLNSPLLVQTPEANILIDTGLGNKLSTKQKEIFRVCRDWSLVEDLQDLGLERQDIDIVLLTHCDFDHAGGVVMFDEEQQEPTLTFPAARHIVQQREWEDVLAPDIRSSHTYWPENFAGLADSGLLKIIEGEAEISPGIHVQLTGGHTRGYQLVEIRGSAGCAVHLGDLFPTHTHVNPLWVMAYDNYPLDVIKLKQELFSRYITKECWFTFYHDIYMKACRLNTDLDVIQELN